MAGEANGDNKEGGGTPRLQGDGVGAGSSDPLSAADVSDVPTPEAEPLDVATVQSWLARTRPATVLALLKDPDHGFAVSRAFLGFRPDAKGYANPLVRSRLVQAAVKDAKMADKLRELSGSEPLPSPVTPKPSPTPPQVSLAAPEKPDALAALRAERDQRRRERDEARLALTLAQAEREAAQKSQKAVEAAQGEAERLARKQADRISRLERQVARLQQGETRLLKALSEDKVSPPPSAPARFAQAVQAEAERTASPWLTAVHHLLDKGKFDPALALAEDVLKADAENGEALGIAALALEGKKDGRAAAAYTRRLLGLEIIRQEMASAAETLRRLLRLLSRPEGAEAEARQYLLALSPSDRPAVEAGRLLLTRLRGADPYTHGWLANIITAQTSLAPVLMPPPGALGPDSPLPLLLESGSKVTARQVAEAVDRGAPLVDAVRAALLALEAADPETHSRIWTALEQAASDDSARLLAVRRTPRGPVVVDGSNVAWFDQESLVHGQPRLRHLRAVRRALWARGFFPVVLYADANLPYFIDEPGPLRLLRDSRELLLVDAGTQADEALLRTAKLLGAPLVTNDRMEDWDPEHEVTKLRYTISMSGEAHLLNEI